MYFGKMTLKTRVNDRGGLVLSIRCQCRRGRPGASGSLTCPNCRAKMRKTLTFLNLAVEKAFSELPVQCQHCGN